MCTKCFKETLQEKCGAVANKRPRLAIQETLDYTEEKKSDVETMDNTNGKKSDVDNMDNTDGKKQSDNNKCDSCSRKVRLMGFECKCNLIFCSEHRDPSMHNCSFDYKTHGRSIIAKNNAKVTGSKLRLI